MAPLTGPAFHDPTLTGPRPTPTLPKGGLFSAYSSTPIAAHPQIVYDALLNVGDWPEWNTFVPEVRITKTSDPHQGSRKRMTGGTCMVFFRNLNGGDKRLESRQVVLLVEKLKLRADGHSGNCVTRIRWGLDNAAITTPGFMLKCERVNEIEELEDGSTMYRTWESFGGPVARTVRRKFEAAWRERLQDWSQDLKGYCEGVVAKRGGVLRAESSVSAAESLGGAPADPEKRERVAVDAAAEING